jgi:ABC-type sugar transport system ATPase subunit
MELYNFPKNRFVGGFIGSPKMNFIESHVLGASNNNVSVDLLDTGKISITVSSKTIKEGDRVSLGIRPEHLLVNKETKSFWEGRVFVVEKLGSATFLYLEKEGEPLVVETTGDSTIKVGDIVKVGFEPSRCHVFNKENQTIS